MHEPHLTGEVRITHFLRDDIVRDDIVRDDVVRDDVVTTSFPTLHGC